MKRRSTIIYSVSVRALRAAVLFCAAAWLLMPAVSCERRPLSDQSYNVYLELEIEDEITNYELESLPEVMKVNFYDPQTEALMYEDFVGPQGGDLSVPPGTYHMVVYNFGSSLLRAVGDTVRPLLFMVISGALNVGLNLLFVVGFGMDVAGVAIATSLSQTVSAILVTVRLCTCRDLCRLDLRRIRLYPDKAAVMLKVGLSAGLQGIIFSAANVMIQSAVNSFGAAVIAGNTAATGLENFIHTAQNTFYQAAITFTGQSLGARKPRQAIQVFWICMGLTVGLGLVLCILLRLFQNQLLGLYIKPTDESYAAVMAAGVTRVLAVSQFQWVGGMMETACGSLRGLGRSLNPTVTTLIGACGLRVVWLYTVFAAVGTIESLYWSYPVSWLLTLAVHCLFLLIYLRRPLSAPEK